MSSFARAICLGSVLVGVLVPVLARALPPETRGRNRADAQQAVLQIQRGDAVLSAVSRLSYLGEEPWAAGRLMEALEHETDPYVRRNLAMALASLRVPRAGPTLAELTQDPDPAIRMSAAEGLGRLHSRQVDALVPLLEDKNPGVRRRAAEALGYSEDGKLGKRLIRAAHGEDDPEVRAEMLVAVGRVGDKSQAKALEAFLRSSSESTRFSAARALCLLGANAGRTYARKLLRSPEKTERRQGLLLYEGAKAKVARPELEKSLEDKEPSIAAVAGRILYQGGDKQMLEWLVLQSFASAGDAKLAYEQELETLNLTDAQRAAILRRKGVRR